MPHFPHEEIHLSGDVNARFEIYNSSDSYVPEHWHRSLEVLYIYEGMMEVLIGQRSHRLFADDFLVINSAVVHATRSPMRFWYRRSRILTISSLSFPTIRFQGRSGTPSFPWEHFTAKNHRAIPCGFPVYCMNFSTFWCLTFR